MIKYPDRIPIIVKTIGFKIDKDKYLAPSNIELSNFVNQFRKINSYLIDSTQTIFVFINNIICLPSDRISIIYEKYKSQLDDCLHITISIENFFG
uniref:Ubiquitin-like protein ATG12 n=1 Tax=viral metagenome TaxID=1070528 RepID=A0A6C0LQV3_9ZZZZ